MQISYQHFRVNVAPSIYKNHKQQQGITSQYRNIKHDKLLAHLL